jgi:prepilin-type processing-associated H-X9-DG protein
LLPAVQAAREAARRIQCANNLHQLSLAAHNYHDAHLILPAGICMWSVNGQPRNRSVSLFVQMLPQIEQGNLAAQWDFGEPLNNVSSGRAATVLATIICPSDALPSKTVEITNQNPAANGFYALTSYGGVGGVQTFHPARATLDGVFYTNSDTRLGDIRDGTSNTLLLAERYHRDVEYEARTNGFTKLAQWGVWAPATGPSRIGDVTLGALAPIGYTHPAQMFVDETWEDRRVTAIGSGHTAGANTAFADGSVRYLPADTHLSTLQALSTRARGEVNSE